MCDTQEKFQTSRELLHGCSGSTVKFLFIYLYCSDSHAPATMEPPLAPTADYKVCAVNSFSTAKNKSATEIYQELCSVYNEDVY